MGMGAPAASCVLEIDRRGNGCRSDFRRNRDSADERPVGRAPIVSAKLTASRACLEVGDTIYLCCVLPYFALCIIFSYRFA